MVGHGRGKGIDRAGTDTNQREAMNAAGLLQVVHGAANVAHRLNQEIDAGRCPAAVTEAGQIEAQAGLPDPGERPIVFTL